MSKMKKVLLMCTAYVLVAALAIGGTIAYLQDSDSDVNVMTLGNVSIRQNEEQRVDPAKNGTLTDADIKDFEQAKPLYPYVDENLNGALRDDYEQITFPNGKTHKLFIGDNAIDKLVSVTNTGKTDAYVRTIIALEAPTDKIDLSFNSTDWMMDTTASTHSIEVGSVKYDLFVCIYKNVLEPDETTPYSLLQIALDRTATNEDAAAYGDTYDVLVLSQAIQTAGFDSASTALDAGFGVVNSESAAEWFGGAEIPGVVSDADGLIEALENDKDVVLTKSVKIDPAKMSNAYGKTGINVKNGQTIDGNGYTIDIKGAGGTWDSGINTTGGLIKNLTVTGSFRGIFINHNSTHSEPVVLENVTIDGTTYTISCDQGMQQNLIATDSAFKGWTSYAATLGTATFTDCYFGEGNGYAYCRPYAPTTFVNCDFEAGYEMDARAAVTFENCTIGGVALTADNLSTLVTSNIENATIQ